MILYLIPQFNVSFEPGKDNEIQNKDLLEVKRKDLSEETVELTTEN